jgi:hypothetical protein
MHPYQPGPKSEAQQRPPEQPAKPIRWIDVKYQGLLIYRVDADDPTHIQLYFKSYGKKQVLQSLTTSRAVTACGE